MALELLEKDTQMSCIGLKLSTVLNWISQFQILTPLQTTELNLTIQDSRVILKILRRTGYSTFANRSTR